MRGARRRRSGERGETLIELLVTVVIMGIAVVALVAGVGVAISSSDSHRQDATAEGVLRSFGERLRDPSGVLYDACAVPATYQTALTTAGFAPPAGWTATITGISYLQSDNTYGSACCSSTDRGAERIDLKVVSPHAKNGAVESMSIVKRRASALDPAGNGTGDDDGNGGSGEEGGGGGGGDGGCGGDGGGGG